MFSSIWKFINRMFTKNPLVAQLVVKDLALRTFMRRPTFAAKAQSWCNYVLDAIKNESVVSLESLNATMTGYLSQLNFTPEEQMLMSTLTESFRKQLSTDLKASGVTLPLAQMGKAAEYITWIQDAARAAQETR